MSELQQVISLIESLRSDIANLTQKVESMDQRLTSVESMMKQMPLSVLQNRLAVGKFANSEPSTPQIPRRSLTSSSTPKLSTTDKKQEIYVRNLLDDNMNEDTIRKVKESLIEELGNGEQGISKNELFLSRDRIGTTEELDESKSLQELSILGNQMLYVRGLEDFDLSNKSPSVLSSLSKSKIPIGSPRQPRAKTTKARVNSGRRNPLPMEITGDNAIQKSQSYSDSPRTNNIPKSRLRHSTELDTIQTNSMFASGDIDSLSNLLTDFVLDSTTLELQESPITKRKASLSKSPLIPSKKSKKDSKKDSKKAKRKKKRKSTSEAKDERLARRRSKSNVL